MDMSGYVWISYHISMVQVPRCLPSMPVWCGIVCVSPALRVTRGSLPSIDDFQVGMTYNRGRLGSSSLVHPTWILLQTLEERQTPSRWMVLSGFSHEH